MSSQANKREHHNRLVSAPQGISEDTTEDRRDVNKEAVESSQCERGLLASPEGTSNSARAILGRDSTGGRESWEGCTNVVVVDICCTVVRPSRDRR